MALFHILPFLAHYPYDWFLLIDLCRICYMKYGHSDRGRESFGAKKQQNKTSVINVN